MLPGKSERIRKFTSFGTELFKYGKVENITIVQCCAVSDVTTPKYELRLR